MAKSYKWLGPGDVLQLEEGGKVYKPGDDVPMSEKLAEHMVKNGHWVEGFELPATSGSAAVESHPELMPKK